MRASDVMTSQVVCARPDMTVREVAGLFVDQGISGAPVTDVDGRVVGMISEGDLLHRIELGTDTQRRSWWLELFSLNRDAKDYIKTHALKVQDVMTTGVISVDENMPLSDVANLLETRHIKRVPVTRAGQLVGIVSRANLVQALASMPHEPAADVTLPDHEIRAILMGDLSGRNWAFAGRNIIVTNGVVHLWGIYHSMDSVRAVRVLAESIPGVKGVEDHTEPIAVMPGI